MIKLCLTAIVKDEAPVIARMLRSVRPFISSYSISDTGSTDNTMEIIREELAGIPGVLKSDEWKDFAANRNLALSRAVGAHTLTIDADEVLHGSLDSLPDYDAIAIKLSRDNVISDWTTRIVRNDGSWQWIGEVHEIPNHTSIPMPFEGLTIESFQDGHQTISGNKYLGHLTILERAERTPRNVFYHARTLFALERFREAIPIFAERVNMGGWHQEVFYSLFQIALCRLQLNYPIKEIAIALLRAHDVRPSRPEPVLLLANLFARAGNAIRAYQMLNEFQEDGGDTLLLDPHGVTKIRAQRYALGRELGVIN